MSSGICRNHGGASSPRAAVTGCAWVHAPPLAMPRNGQTWDVFFSSPFSTSDLQKKTPNHNSQLILVVLSLFANLLFSLLCFQACRIWSSVWLHVPPTDQACGWLDRQPSSSHFISISAASSTAAMVGRSAHLSSLGLLLFLYCPSASLLISSLSLSWAAGEGMMLLLAGENRLRGEWCRWRRGASFPRVAGEEKPLAGKRGSCRFGLGSGCRNGRGKGGGSSPLMLLWCSSGQGKGQALAGFERKKGRKPQK